MLCDSPSIKTESEAKLTEIVLDENVVQRHYVFAVEARLSSQETVFTELEWALDSTSQIQPDEVLGSASSTLSEPPRSIKTKLQFTPAVTAVPSVVRRSKSELTTEGETIWLHSEDELPFTLIASDSNSSFEIRESKMAENGGVSTSLKVHVRLRENLESAIPRELVLALSHPYCKQVTIRFEE